MPSTLDRLRLNYGMLTVGVASAAARLLKGLQHTGGDDSDYKASHHQGSLGSISLMRFPSNFQSRLIYMYLYFPPYRCDHCKILHIPRQLSCLGMCKILLWSDQFSLNYTDDNFYWIWFKYLQWDEHMASLASNRTQLGTQRLPYNRM